jgi:hypothetical protein
MLHGHGKRLRHVMPQACHASGMSLKMDRFPANLVSGSMGLKRATFFEGDEMYDVLSALRTKKGEEALKRLREFISFQT